MKYWTQDGMIVYFSSKCLHHTPHPFVYFCLFWSIPWSQLSFYSTSSELHLLCCLIFPLTCNYNYSIFLRSSNWLFFLFVLYFQIESSFSLCYIISYLSKYFIYLTFYTKVICIVLFLIDQYSITWHTDGASDSLSISLFHDSVFS